MLSNAYFIAKFRFDTAENEPAKNLQKKTLILLLSGSRTGLHGGGAAGGRRRAPFASTCATSSGTRGSSTSTPKSGSRSSTASSSRSGRRSPRLCFFYFFQLLVNFWQTLRGPFLAVSKPNFASEYSFISS